MEKSLSEPMSIDWTPTPIDPARRLFQVRQALEMLHLTKEHRDGLQELATNLEKKFTATPKRVQKGN